LSYQIPSSAYIVVQASGFGEPEETAAIQNAEILGASTYSTSTTAKQASPSQTVAPLDYGPPLPESSLASESSTISTSSTGPYQIVGASFSSASTESSPLAAGDAADASSMSYSTPGSTTTPTIASSPSSGSKASGIVYSNGSNSIRTHVSFSPLKFISLILCFFIFVDATAAFSTTTPMTEVSSSHFTLGSSTLPNVTNLELRKRATQPAPGWKQFADLFTEYLAGKISTPELAGNLVDELAEAVCDHATGVLITKAFGVDLVEACVAAIDVAGGVAALGTLQPEIEFAAVLGSGILCNLLVSEALPGIGALTDAICKQEKPCSENLQTDVNNCGRCGNTVSVSKS
jgi:hypothetical protein